MAQVSISISNQSGASISANGQSTDPAVIAAAQVVIDALNASATDVAD